jgi:hypothetical protein
MGKRAQNFHHGSVTAEREHRVVLVRVHFGDDCCVAGRFRAHHVAVYAGFGERFQRLATNPVSAPRRRINDQQDSLDPPRLQPRRRRRAHAASNTLRTCIARFSAVNDIWTNDMNESLI